MPLLQGEGPDGHPYHVDEDSKGYLIRCGLSKRTTVRLTLKPLASPLSHELVVERISNYLSTRSKTGAELKRRTEQIDEEVLSEGLQFTGELPAKRTREPRLIYSVDPSEAGSDAAVNRDYEAERERRERNAATAEEKVISFSSYRRKQEAISTNIQPRGRTGGYSLCASRCFLSHQR